MPVDLDAIRRGLGVPTAEDRHDWNQIRDHLKNTLGESQFDIWLEPVELVASDSDRVLVLALPAATAAWLRDRFGGVLAASASSVGREMRFAERPEICALATDGPSRSTFPNNRKEAAE